MPMIPDIVASIDAQLEQLQSEMAALERARAALGGEQAPTATRSGAPRSAGPRSRRRAATTARVPRQRKPAAAPAAAPPTPAPAPAPAQTETETAAAAPAPAPAPPPARRGRRRGSDGQGEVERIEAMLREFGGLSAVAIAKRLGRGDRAVRDTLRQLEADGRIRSEGSRRTSLWRLVSDEEKIATRVSELEAARRRDAS